MTTPFTRVHLITNNLQKMKNTNVIYIYITLYQGERGECSVELQLLKDKYIVIVKNAIEFKLIFVSKNCIKWKIKI